MDVKKSRRKKTIVMTIKQIKRNFYSELEKSYPKTEIESFFYLIMDAYYGLKRVDITLNPLKEFNIDDKFHKVLNDLTNQIPIQYILGFTEFYGMNFRVNQHVLIPRPETEELVEWILLNQPQKKNNNLTVLDIGTGSGCIAISLAKNLPNAQVFGLDVSKEALCTANLNSLDNQVTVNFIEDDILDSVFNIHSLDKFDVIVSNPPYVRESEKELMNNNVLENEPHLALFVNDENPLLFYNRIADFAKENLVQNGKLYFEINQYLAKETMSLLKEKGFGSIELKKDIFGKDRMIKAKKL